MYVCLMDRQGKKLVHGNVKGHDFDYFLKLIKPYRHSLTVCSEYLAMIRHFDQPICQLEEELQRQTKRVACREFTSTVHGVSPGIYSIYLNGVSPDCITCLELS
jgi:hypothetical protein